MGRKAAKPERGAKPLLRSRPGSSRAGPDKMSGLKFSLEGKRFYWTILRARILSTVCSTLGKKESIPEIVAAEATLLEKREETNASFQRWK